MTGRANALPVQFPQDCRLAPCWAGAARNIAAPWNIAVRTRGVFTHRDDFQKPACAERGLVRTVSQPFSGKYGPCIHFWMLVFDIKDVYIGGADLASDGIVMKDAGKRGDFCPAPIK